MQEPTATEAVTRAGRREWLGLLVLALPTLLVSLDVGALYLALPHLTSDLGATSTQQLWITDIYGFLTAGLLITMGNLGDRIGRRRLLLIGAAAFGVMSLAAAYSTSAEMLIVSRALLGVAGATLMPSTLALISNMFHDDRQRGVAIAAWVSCMMVGAAIGPVAGGLMIGYFWWGSVFLLGVPVMVMLLVFGPRLLPEFRNAEAGRLDLLSVLLSLVAILSIVYGVKEIAAYGADRISVAGPSIALGLVLGVLFVRRQLRLASPLLDLRLFRARRFSATLASMLLAAASLAGLSLLISQYVQSVAGLPPGEAGLWLMPSGIAIAVGSQLAPVLVRRMQPGTAIVLSLLVGVVGFLLISMVDATGQLGLVVTGTVLVHLGAGPLFALGAHLVVGSVPPERAGSAASMSETSNSFGSTLGLALMGVIGTAAYRLTMADYDVAGASATAETAARETLAGAVGTAATVPADTAAALLTAARESFTPRVNNAAGTRGLVFLGAAVLIGVVFRSRDTPEAPAETPAGSALTSENA